MPFLDRLERALGRFAIPNAGLYLVIGQAVVLLGVMLRVVDPERLDFAPALVTEAGEWWRIFTFMLLVPMPGIKDKSVRLSGFVDTGYTWGPGDRIRLGDMRAAAGFAARRSAAIDTPHSSHAP